jgi:metal-responsive CopG/Arc/MetJ family transcriptional regulator
MPRTRQPTNSSQISVTLPGEVLEMLEHLISEHVYGNTRAQVARQLIFDQIKVLRANKVLKP